MTEKIRFQDIYILLNVGCIECGEPTEILGVFETNEEAQSALNTIEEPDYFKGGRHHIGIYSWKGAKRVCENCEHPLDPEHEWHRAVRHGTCEIFRFD